MSEIYLLGAGFSMPAGLPCHRNLTKLALEKLVQSEKQFWRRSIIGNESPKALAANSETKPTLTALFLLQVFEALGDEIVFDEFYKISRLFFSSQGRIRVSGMPVKLAEEWEELIRQGQFTESRVYNELGNAVAKVIEQQTVNSSNLEYVNRFVAHCEEKKAHIFTTNYDLLLEQALERRGLLPNVAGTENSAYVDLPLSSSRLYKLHGSLDWDVSPRFHDRPITEYPITNHRNVSSGGLQNMALDDSEKLSQVSFRLSSLVELDRLWSTIKRVTAIGFSFSDYYINGTIFHRMHHPGYKLVCVTPDSGNALEKRLEGLRCQILRATGGLSNIEYRKVCASEFCMQSIV
jgi:SIR2-like domain